MPVSNRGYLLQIGTFSLLLSGIKSDSCPTQHFKNWLGNSFSVTSWEECTSWFITCWTSKCTPHTNIFDSAIASTGWDFTLPWCNDEYLTVSESTNDMECSAPVDDPLSNEYKGIFHESCQIHDMCLKTNGRTAAACDSEFYVNMVATCNLQYPDFETAAALVLCHSAALTWYGAVANWCDNPIVEGSCHWGGIEPSLCNLQLAPGTALLTVYCDDSCTVYRADTQKKPWSAKTNVGSSNNWQKPLEITLSSVTSNTNMFIDVQDNGGIGGMMACMYRDGETWCTKQGSNFKPIYSSSSTGTIWMSGTSIAKGSGDWGNNMIDSPRVQDSYDPYWIWEAGATNNRMIFRFNFNNVI